MSFWIFISIFNLFAADVVIQSKSSNNFEYQKYLQENPQQISFMAHLAQKISQNKNITNHLKRAQFEFLKGSLEEAKEEFRKITELRFENDWNHEQRKTINYSFLRLAQLERNKANRSAILKTALLFDQSYSPSSELFPPALIKTYEDIKRQRVNQVWPLPEKATQYDTLLVNGKPVDFASGFIKKEEGMVRLSFLSNKWLPQNYTLNTKEIESIKLPTIPMVQGNCHNPVFNTLDHLKKSPIVFEKGCVGKVQTQLAQLPIEDIKDYPSLKSKKEKSKFYHSKWFWIGASVVAAGFTAYYLDQQNQRGGAPAQNPTPPPSSEPVVFTNN